MALVQPPTARDEVLDHLTQIGDLIARHRLALAVQAARMAERERVIAGLVDLAADYARALTVLPERPTDPALTADDLTDLAALYGDPFTDPA